MVRLIATLSGIFIFLASSTLLAKSPEDRIYSLEQQIAAIQKTYLKNNQDIASSIAQAQAIKEEWGILKGQVDANRHLITSQSENLIKQITELDHRIQSIEDRMAIFSSQLSKALGKIAPDAAAEGDLYQNGLELVNQSKYLEAAAAFEKFIKKYPNSPFAASALAWIGESFYSMRDYQRAIKEYQRFLEKYPRDKNVSTAILKQGSSFYELGMIEEAKAFYQKILQSYPTSSAAAQAQTKLNLIKERESKASAAEAGASPLGSYPGETIEQQQHRLRGNSEPPQQTQQMDQKGAKKKPSPIREF